VSDPALARAWLAAVCDERITLELEGIYDYIGAAVESRGPACWASGRCCSFEAAGHRLYVTGLEAAYTVAKLRSDQQVEPANSAMRPRAELTAESLSSALDSGGCPFQGANMCNVHTIKPLGCRVYFCDRSAQRWQEDLSEAMLARIRALHERYRIEYRYGEWREMLGAFI
jgi:Fe-S-cluster containining protein